ncbi:hypothetical protein FRB98_003351 [Tulasnella sp. 332]|nr:hypothetical protein FRB98_003351 [Tulasnella sp. 332]
MQIDNPAIANLYSHAIPGLLQRLVLSPTPEPGLAWLYVPDPSTHSDISHYVRGLVKTTPAETMIMSLLFLTQLPFGRHDCNNSPTLSEDLLQLRAVLLRGSLLDQCFMLHTLGGIMALKTENDARFSFKRTMISSDRKRRLLALDRLAWKILGAKANVKAQDWMRMLESVGDCGGPSVQYAIWKMMFVAATVDACATAEVRRISAMSNSMGPTEDLTAQFIAESQLIEKQAAMTRLVASKVECSPPHGYWPCLHLVPNPSPEFESPRPKCLPPSWTSPLSQHLQFTMSPSAISSYAIESLGEIVLERSDNSSLKVSGLRSLLNSRLTTDASLPQLPLGVQPLQPRHGSLRSETAQKMLLDCKSQGHGRSSSLIVLLSSPHGTPLQIAASPTTLASGASRFVEVSSNWTFPALKDRVVRPRRSSPPSSSYSKEFIWKSRFRVANANPSISPTSIYSSSMPVSLEDHCTMQPISPAIPLDVKQSIAASVSGFDRRSGTKWWSFGKLFKTKRASAVEATTLEQKVVEHGMRLEQI